jgi:heme A synthase
VVHAALVDSRSAALIQHGSLSIGRSRSSLPDLHAVLCYCLNQACDLYLLCCCSQFDHRLLATTTLAATLVLWPWVRKSSDLPQRARLSMDLVAAVTAFQFTLGVWTLLEYVPVHLGSAHQVGGWLLSLSAEWC